MTGRNVRAKWVSKSSAFSKLASLGEVKFFKFLQSFRKSHSSVLQPKILLVPFRFMEFVKQSIFQSFLHLKW